MYLSNPLYLMLFNYTLLKSTNQRIFTLLTTSVDSSTSKLQLHLLHSEIMDIVPICPSLRILPRRLFALISSAVAEFFGTRSHGLILGILIFSGSVGGSIGPLVTGHIFDTTASYRVAFLLLLSLAITGFTLILSSGSAERKAMSQT